MITKIASSKYFRSFVHGLAAVAAVATAAQAVPGKVGADATAVLAGIGALLHFINAYVTPSAPTEPSK